jgi:hypothetical protein
MLLSALQKMSAAYAAYTKVRSKSKKKSRFKGKINVKTAKK